MAAPAFARKVVTVIDTMVGELKKSPTWGADSGRAHGELNKRLLDLGDAPPDFTSKLEASQPYLSDTVKNLPTEWEHLGAEEFLTKLKEDVLSTFPEARGGRRTRRTRKHRSRSRKYRSRK